MGKKWAYSWASPIPHMSFLGREEGRKTALLGLPVRCLHAQKMNKSCKCFCCIYHWLGKAWCDERDNLLSSMAAIIQELPKRKKKCGQVLREFKVNDSFHHCKLWQLLMINLLKVQMPLILHVWVFPVPVLKWCRREWWWGRLLETTEFLLPNWTSGQLNAWFGRYLDYI